MRWFVPALCGVAALAAVTMGAADEVAPATGPASADEPEPRSDASELADAQELIELRGVGTEVTPLDPGDQRRIVRDCLAVPAGADPSLSPDRDAVDVVATGETEGIAVVVWIGPAPQYERAVGTCLALDRGGGWSTVGRSIRRDLGPGTPTVTWQPVASGGGAGAALVGRVRRGAAEAVLVLDDGRVLYQKESGGFLAIPWQPVRDPARLVTISSDGQRRYDGPLAAYADGG